MSRKSGNRFSDTDMRKPQETSRTAACWAKPNRVSRGRAAPGVWRSLVARKFWVLQVAGSNPAAPTIPRGSRERRSDERTYLPADEERHAIGCGADQILAVRIRAGKAARGRA